MKKHGLIFLLAFVFVILYFRISLPHGQPSLGHFVVPDADADYLVTERIFLGQGLYQDFSIIYPPGRFFWQAIFFKIFGPSMVVLSVLHIGMSMVFYPAALLLASYFLFFKLAKEHWQFSDLGSVLLSNLAAIFSVVIYLGMIRSGQEAHVLLGLFMAYLLSLKKLNKWSGIVIGLFAGLITLFRIDSGIMVMLALISVFGMSSKKDIQLVVPHFKKFMIGFSIPWILSVLAILNNGSLFNFIYDTIILGLFIQPKYMGLSIPENDLRLVFWSTFNLLLAVSSGLYLQGFDSKKFVTRFGIQFFAAIGLLSYVAALGRSDEPHLWYSLVWLTPISLFGIGKLVLALYHKRGFSWNHFLIMLLALPFFSALNLEIKSPKFFLIFGVLWLMALRKLKIDPKSILVAGFITTLLIFHSLAYFNLRWGFPVAPKWKNFNFEWVLDDESEIAGMSVQPQLAIDLDTIKADLPEDLEYLFIYPKNTLYNHYFGFKNPTRYILLAYERSDWIDSRIVSDLESTQTEYILVFKEWAESTQGNVYPWILENSKVIKTYDFALEEVQLRQRIY